MIILSSDLDESELLKSEDVFEMLKFGRFPLCLLWNLLKDIVLIRMRKIKSNLLFVELL